MTDRLVRKYNPVTHVLAPPSRFSGHLHERNIVLLGDPGAGKSHLFGSFAGENAVRTARDFLNSPVAALPKSTLFIDGLDEKRTGRGDHTAVDALVAKLFEVEATNVRVACRVADWLGSTDLGAFSPYFDTHGNVSILVLEAMSEVEVLQMLHAIGCTQPEAFVTEARSRGLDDLLGNPQTLQMLNAAVQSKNWPTSRRELFAQAVDILLAEFNDIHSTKDAGSFTSGELLMPAGALCAARLMGDVDAISLHNQGEGVLLPSYRTIGEAFPRNQLYAALTRRVFRATGRPNTVDYGHRTVAEYLAAYFLATQIRNGLPINRVRALLGVEGRPASELRGLHAWLAVLLPLHAELLIESDAFGVLSYGDAASLSQPHRAFLLAALSRLAQEDPWFRHGNWSTTSLHGLASADMLEPFRAVLTLHGTTHALVSIVMDAMSVGPPMAGLKEELIHCFFDTDQTDGVRKQAFDHLLRIGPSVYPECIDALHRIAQDSRDFLVRISTTVHLVEKGLVGADEIATLLNDAFASPRTRVISSGLRGFDRHIPHGLEREVLDRLAQQRIPQHGPDSHLASQAIEVVDALLVRLIGSEVASTYLVERLVIRDKALNYRHPDSAKGIADALRAKPSLLNESIKDALNLTDELSGWKCMLWITRVFAGAADERLMLERMLSRLVSSPATPDPRDYDIALTCTLRLGTQHRTEFEWLFGIADDHAALQPVRAALCTNEIDKWRQEDAQRRQGRELKHAAALRKQQKDFDRNVQAILSGRQLSWLAHIGRLYFSLFSDTEAKSTPAARLTQFLGVARVPTALQGLRALVERGEISSLEEIIAMHRHERYWEWWYAVVAGLTEMFDAQGHLNNVLPAYLQSAVAIDILHPTWRGNGSKIVRHPWVDWFAACDPQRLSYAYMTLAQSDLANDATYVHGFNELIRISHATLRSTCVCALLLKHGHAMPTHYLIDALGALLEVPYDDQVQHVFRTGLRRSANIPDVHKVWVAAALMADYFGFRIYADVLLARQAQQEMVLALRHFYKRTRPLPWMLLAYLLRIATCNFSRTDFGDDDDEDADGDRHHWEVSRLISSVIERLAVDTSDEARDVLIRCSVDPRSTSFHDELKHGIAQQTVHRVDAVYRRPNWNEAVAVLRNGPPVSMADLHALVHAHLDAIRSEVKFLNTDLFKDFWNEDSFGRVTAPKPENSCRNVLIELLKPRLEPLGIRVQPEGHMANAKRADIEITVGTTMKLVIELKRHYHDEVWTAAHEQLDRFYSRDPQSQGYGIYGVIWFGARVFPTPRPPNDQDRPTSTRQMAEMIASTIPVLRRSKITSWVLDVSSEPD